MSYEPKEDSFLLQKFVKKCARGSVLDMGTGSGIQAIEASKKISVTEVLAVDVQQDALEHFAKTLDSKKIRLWQSDLFSNIKGTFDTIIFNPPYLPDDPKLKDLTLDGGIEGYEVIERFLIEAKRFLNPKGIILIVFSSLTGKEKIDSIIAGEGYTSELLGKELCFFEELYCYKVAMKSKEN